MAHQKPVEQDGVTVRIWLFSLCVLIFAMILVGGATRLTDSGLSITEWQPIMGLVPPLSKTGWQEAFALYKKIPEYQLINKGMSLQEFKFIYWWEWAHRFMGRMIGFAFLLPFLFFLLRGQLSRPLIPKLIIMFVLGGLQGLLGWYMVKSGLVDRTDVSQYRLAAHLCAAVVIFGYIFWTVIRIGADRSSVAGHSGLARGTVIALIAFIFIQIALGAFVAGLDAGQGYNTWPDMDGAFIPEGLGVMTPWYLNLFENALTVQFNHRMVAYAVMALAIFHATLVFSRGMTRPLRTGAAVLLMAILAQAVLGIATLLAKVPISLGLAHQGTAIIVFALALLHLNQLTPGPAPDRR